MRDKGSFLFTSESVADGHPDKVADRISDTVLDAYLAADPEARVACETLVTTNRIVLAGEVRGPDTVHARISRAISCALAVHDIGLRPGRLLLEGADQLSSATCTRRAADIAVGVDAALATRTKAPATRASCSDTPATETPEALMPAPMLLLPPASCAACSASFAATRTSPSPACSPTPRAR